jgi:formate dehydrogenase major subunit
MTNSFGDIQNAKSIFIIGCNPAVNHPVGFGHILKAKEIYIYHIKLLKTIEF